MLRQLCIGCFVIIEENFMWMRVNEILEVFLESTTLYSKPKGFFASGIVTYLWALQRPTDGYLDRKEGTDMWGYIYWGSIPFDCIRI